MDNTPIDIATPKDARPHSSASDRVGVICSAIDRIERITNDEWLSSLTDRKRAELSFHDSKRDRQSERNVDSDTYERFYGNRKYYKATQKSNDYLRQWVDREVPGRVFLDFACGNGGQAIKAAEAGAALSLGFDISPVSVANAKRDAAAAGVADRARFFQADAENTLLPSASVDRVLCAGMLHHLDLSYAFPELRRILVPGGRVFALEALDYNPAIKIYRHLTPHMRTEWEKAHILGLRDLRFARRFFDVENIRYWHITSILAPHVPWAEPALQSIDEVLTHVPGVQLMAWMFSFELVKRPD